MTIMLKSCVPRYWEKILSGEINLCIDVEKMTGI